MRVTGGKFRSRVLVAPQGLNTRPTMDKVKEAMFNILGPSVLNATVLDLFAGSGALGIEALSRGAKKAYFNDANYNAYNTIKTNINTLGIQDIAKISKLDYKVCLKNLTEKIDIILLDPPYKDKIYEEIISCLEDQNLLSGHSIFVIEAERSMPLLERENYLSKVYDYGNKKLIILRQRIEENKDNNS